MNNRGRPSWLAAALAVVFAGVLALQLLSSGGPVRAQTALCPVDTLLVMGAAQYNGEPSPAFARRLDKAYDLYRAGCAGRVVVTGGKQPGDSFTEGGAGVRYLVARGVPTSALVAETQSRSSLENLRLAKPLLAGKRLLIVTDDLHAYRTELLARHLGLEAQVARVTTHGPRLGYALREAAGIAAYLLGVYH